MGRAYVFSRTADGKEYIAGEIEATPVLVANAAGRGLQGTVLDQEQAAANPELVEAIRAWEAGDDTVAREDQAWIDADTPTAAEMGELQRVALGAPIRPPRHLQLVK
jgi:hypothetical protein